MTTDALSGEITKTGKSGKTYVFNFGWALQYALEDKYGPNMQELAKASSNLTALTDILISALRVKSINNIPDELSRQQTVELLDDLTETDIKQLWKAAKHALGFMERVIDLDEASVNALKEAALRNQNQPGGAPPTGTPS